MAEDTAASSDDDSDRAEQPTEESESSPDAHGEPDDSPEGSEEGEEFIDEISDSLSDEGFGVFHGREFVSLRENGQLAPNSTVSKQYLEGKEAVILAYNEDANEIAIIPLEEEYDRTNVYSLQWNDDRVSMSVSGFLKQNNIKPDQTIRYPPEWDEDIGSEKVPGALVIDLDQDGEVAPAANDGTDEEAAEVEA
jgi:hypothetical protein